MSLKRKAIIIAAYSSKHGYLPGAKEDIALHKGYLSSSLGGAWEDGEITVLENPTSKQVRDALQSAKDMDFAFIAFSGHGEHHIGKQLSDTSLCLNDNEEMYVGDINPGNRRHVVLVDACRKVVLLEMKKAADVIALAANRAYAVDWMYRYKCRALFDQELTQAEEGRVIIYSCDLNQAAGETENGGVFTEAMINGSIAWRDLSGALKAEAQSEVLDIPLAFELAKTKVPKPQTPVLHNGRRIRSFPYGVAPRK